jgi:hypothetical protein
MSNTMKLWERIIEHRLRGVTDVTENQFGFMPGRSIMEAIFLIRQLMERYREQKKDLHMIFIDLEKVYDKVPRNVMWWVLQKHKVSSKYIALIKDMYDNVVTSVRTSDVDTNDFLINIGLHQGSALSPYLFALVMDEVTRDIQGCIPWCMLFVDDVVLVDESRTGVDQKLELWRWTLEANTWSMISVLPHKRRRMLDSMVRWYPRKTPFATWDRCSKRIQISMKMLVIELNSAGWSGVKLLTSCVTLGCH